MSWSDARLLLDTLRLDGGLEGGPAARDAWGRADGAALGAVVAWEGGGLWLLRRLVKSGLVESAPAQLVSSLRSTAVADNARNMLVDAETETLLRILEARGIPHVLIKGTARRAAAGIYPYADARATRDVDVLLPPALVGEVWEHLRKEGWPLATHPGATPPGHYHPPPLLGPHRVGVELHASTGHGFTPEEGWRRANDGAVELEWHRLRVRVPSATELLWHGLTHALDGKAAGFRLRYFLDGASILAAGSTVEWDRIAARLEADEGVDVTRARVWLGAAAELAGRDLPSGVSGPSGAFDVVRALAWRMAVLKGRRPEGLTGRLLEEGTRTELGLRVAPMVRASGTFRRARRWVAGRTARLAYRAWRAATRNQTTAGATWS